VHGQNNLRLPLTSQNRFNKKGVTTVQGVMEMKKRVTISVELMNHKPVVAFLKSIGMTYSGFLNACTGMLAYRLRQSSSSDPVTVKGLVDDFMNDMRGSSGKS
jgi:hypothetical protein